MKITLLILSFINAAYMLFDGIHVLVKGKYFGPEKPGPWAGLFEKINIDPFKLGPLFITYGLLWFILFIALLTKTSWVVWYGIILSVLTLWYLPVGTLIAVITIILLLLLRNKSYM